MPMAETLKKMKDSGETPDKVVSSKYDQLSKDYDTIYEAAGWPDPRLCAENVLDLGFTEDSSVLDMGCGTGLVGHHLKEKSGFDKIDIKGIDASQGMINQANERGIYGEFKCLFLGNPTGFEDKHTDIHGKFDFVTASGVLAEGHASALVFDEMLMTLKRGGYAVFTSRLEYLNKLNYQQNMDDRVLEEKWDFVKKVPFEKYSNTRDTEVGCFKPIDSMLFVYRKL
jgi:predicted TPR repeat methyltransferase